MLCWLPIEFLGLNFVLSGEEWEWRNCYWTPMPENWLMDHCAPWAILEEGYNNAMITRISFLWLCLNAQLEERQISSLKSTPVTFEDSWWVTNMCWPAPSSGREICPWPITPLYSVFSVSPCTSDNLFTTRPLTITSTRPVICLSSLLSLLIWLFHHPTSYHLNNLT